jgi:signal transduction histidine kinase
LSFKNQTLDGLKHVGVKVSWDMSALANYQLQEDMHLIEIFRIVQEATHNAVNRAECKYLEFKGSKSLDDLFSIEIINTGGITLKNEIILGSGVQNIKMRTKRIGGDSSLTSVKGGAKFELHLPRSLDILHERLQSNQ